MWQQVLRRAFFVGLLGLAAACGTSAPFTVQSMKAPELQQPIRQVYVFSNVGVDGDVPRDQFEAALRETARTCNLRLELEYVQPSEPAPQGDQGEVNPQFKAAVDKVKRLGMEHFLFIRLAGGTKNQRGGILRAIYDASLFDITTEKRLWRANIAIPMSWTSTDTNLGTMLTRALLNQLVSDGAIDPSCHRDPPPEAPASRRRH